ncbi:MAG: cytochrome c4 [Aquincola sp.]|nr:cytochrome c4 [Aquincola sp.]MDH4290898.1 cytochrome c4 [Aquincola sp.]
MKPALILTLLLSMFSIAQAQDAKPGSAAAGEKKAAMCIGCHGIKGYQATFPEVHKVPMISGQNAKFIASALAAYRKGERKHPTMRAITGSLTDQDIADLAAFYEQHGKAAGSVPEQVAAAPTPVAELVAKGACASCHGANFSKPIDPSYPKIAGQYADYLYAALKAYKTEGNPHVGRGNPIMGGQVKQFSLAELRAIADYVGSLPGELRTVKESYFR